MGVAVKLLMCLLSLRRSVCRAATVCWLLEIRYGGLWGQGRSRSWRCPGEVPPDLLLENEVLTWFSFLPRFWSSHLQHHSIWPVRGSDIQIQLQQHQRRNWHCSVLSVNTSAVPRSCRTSILTTDTTYRFLLPLSIFFPPPCTVLGLCT